MRTRRKRVVAVIVLLAAVLVAGPRASAAAPRAAAANDTGIAQQRAANHLRRGIGWAMWDYDGGFDVVNRQDGKAAPDPATVRALGLTMANPPN